MSGARLTVDLGAVAANWRALAARVAPGECAAVVKADGYGLGAARVGAALMAAGCRTFFVALAEEGLALRDALGAGPRIGVLNGPGGTNARAQNSGDLIAQDQIPVLNHTGDVEAWQAARSDNDALPAFLHVDTGMNRLGFAMRDWPALWQTPERLSGLNIQGVLSHLACADTPDHPLNAAQLDRFRQALAQTGQRLPASFANSSGIFLGPGYHFDLARPGAALWGVNPVPGTPNPMRQVAALDAPILQVRRVDRGESVGYGAARQFGGPATLATIAIGYADGFFRSLGDTTTVFLDSHPMPVVGRVSMDLICVDATHVPAELVHPGARVEIIGPNRTVDAIADDAGTIGYEVLTSLGRRFERRYVNEPAQEGAA